MTEAEEIFLREVVSIARSLGGFSTAVAHATEFAIELTGEGAEADETVAYLDHLFAEIEAAPAVERLGRVKRFLGVASGLGARPASWDAAAARIHVVVRPPALVRGHAVMARPIFSHLCECIVLDGCETFSYVTAADVARWERNEAEVFDRARENVDQLSHAIGPSDVAAPSPLWRVSTDDAYESSRLLSPRFLQAMARHVVGRVVCAVPERGTLLAVGDASLDAVVRLADAAETEFLASSRAVSPALYAVEDGRAVPFEPGVDHPLSAVARRGHALLASSSYAEQKTFLDQLHASKELDVHVARFIAVEREGLVRTVATWTRDAETLLPRTELVAFVDLGEGGAAAGSFFVPWDDVTAIAGGALTPAAGLYPERWRTLRYPTPDEIGRLRECTAG